MLPEVVGEIQRRRPAIPWNAPIRVHFSCDDKPLFACRLCILRFGLKIGDRSHLFGDETEALVHIGSHAGQPAVEQGSVAAASPAGGPARLDAWFAGS